MSFMLLLLYYFTVSEIIITLMLLFPFKPLRIFFHKTINSLFTNFYLRILIFMVIIVITLTFIDHFNEVRHLHHNLETADSIMSCQNQIRYFRAQRNLYITGLSLFAALVIYLTNLLFSKDNESITTDP